MDHVTRISRPAEPGGAPTTPPETGGPRTTSGRSHRRHQAESAAWNVPASWSAWALGLILVVQAVLAFRLVRADTAFQDEALYLWAGHREWAHLLHGTPVPPFPAYFSGAPAIYPLFGALTDNIGGLSAARILSLIFMLGTTGLLWATARRLYGPMAAVFSAALFGVLGPTLHLSSFATYDAMAVFLVALSAWLVVRAADQRDATGWIIAAGVALALGNATSYSIALFDPVVILLALLVAFPSPGGRRAFGRCLILLTVVIVLLGIGLLVGGTMYRTGIDNTIIDRARQAVRARLGA